MKYSMILTLILTFVTFSQEPKWRTITVQGEAEINLIADKATFKYGVVGFGPTLRHAVDDAKSKAVEINRKLLSIGVPQASIHTEDFISQENADKAFLSSKKDFTARISTSVSLSKVDLMQEAILVLSESQPERISRIVFSLDDMDAAKNQALQAAARDARLKAQLLTKELGITLGEPILIETAGLSATPYYFDRSSVRGGRAEEAMFFKSSQPPPLMQEALFISPKEITVRERVKVLFSY